MNPTLLQRGKESDAARNICVVPVPDMENFWHHECTHAEVGGHGVRLTIGTPKVLETQYSLFTVIWLEKPSKSMFVDDVRSL